MDKFEEAALRARLGLVLALGLLLLGLFVAFFGAVLGGLVFLDSLP